MTEYETKSLALLEQIAKNTAGGAPKAAVPAGTIVFPGYGKSAGAPVAGAAMKDLEFYGKGCVRTLDNPEKSKWHDKERTLLAAINAEIVKQGGAPIRATADDFGPLPPDAASGDDESIPF